MNSILIKSSDRELGTPSHNFNLPLHHTVEGKYIVKHAMIPNTMYNIYDQNNKFSFLTVTTTDIITLTPGNYSAADLTAELKLQMELLPNITTCTASISGTTGKLSIDLDMLAPEVLVRILFNVIGIAQDVKNIGRVLGMNTLESVVFTNTVANTWSTTGDSVIHLNHAVSVAIQIDSAGNGNFENVCTGSGAQIYVPLSLGFGFYKTLSSGEFPQYISLKRSRSLKIRVVDTSNDRPINLNGGEIEILMEKLV